MHDMYIPLIAETEVTPRPPIHFTVPSVPSVPFVPSGFSATARDGMLC